ncbi:MAG: pyridoxal 5'-phosphate synthase glutaminase subunit PdxT, partial [Dehalococcoidia bacterium]|nr:pyridoxal 5'-phosphate synthase glutaminase subunit PdxT [Dehalococcoidia bacterium]
MTTIGVLGLQGGFAEHLNALHRLGVEARDVRLPRDLAGLDGLIIPGGESTTIGKLMVQYDLLAPIADRAAHGFPIWGTCAGLIMLARRLDGQTQPLIGAMDITVKRNAFGRQVDSFETPIAVRGLQTPFPAI